jgi:hypothetical protein
MMEFDMYQGASTISRKTMDYFVDEEFVVGREFGLLFE